MVGMSRSSLSGGVRGSVSRGFDGRWILMDEMIAYWVTSLGISGVRRRVVLVPVVVRERERERKRERDKCFLRLWWCDREGAGERDVSGECGGERETILGSCGRGLVTAAVVVWCWVVRVVMVV
ncbi:hypothetical protein ACFE04_029202 [Oxalis oulophora]